MKLAKVKRTAGTKPSRAAPSRTITLYVNSRGKTKRATITAAQGNWCHIGKQPFAHIWLAMVNKGLAQKSLRARFNVARGISTVSSERTYMRTD
jgi:hypothetical protein